ncbi:MAG: SUF system NifU family Fe-S cluster assembly protein [bacterium]|nr:SUF system NifU family Fe-S cluster assembly protein [bacterium]
MSSSLDDMYREIIMDHYRSPRGRAPLPNADVSSDGMNPSCGDEINVAFSMDKDILTDVHVNCKGCAISVASGSMLAETVKGKSFEDVRKISEIVKKMLKGEEVEIPDDPDFEDLSALKGVRQFPVRIKCALLAWVTLVEGMEKYRAGGADSAKAATTEEDQ